jgi:hypothetical protein
MSTGHMAATGHHIYPVRAQRAGNRFRIIALANYYVQQQQHQQVVVDVTSTVPQSIDHNKDMMIDYDSDNSVTKSPATAVFSSALRPSNCDMSSNRVGEEVEASSEQPLDNQRDDVAALAVTRPAAAVSSQLLRRSRLPYAPRQLQKNYIVLD